MTEAISPVRSALRTQSTVNQEHFHYRFACALVPLRGGPRYIVDDDDKRRNKSVCKSRAHCLAHTNTHTHIQTHSLHYIGCYLHCCVPHVRESAVAARIVVRTIDAMRATHFA